MVLDYQCLKMSSKKVARGISEQIALDPTTANNAVLRKFSVDTPPEGKSQSSTPVKEAEATK